MTSERIFFIGFLTNTDASILQVNLDHGFKMEAISEKEGLALISTLEGVTQVQASRIIFMDFPCLNYNENKLYVISNSFETVVKKEGEGLLRKVPEFDNKFVRGYLDRVIQLMRLFKEGDLRMPLKYYYYIEKPNVHMRLTSHRYVSREPYHLESSELPDLYKFIEDTKLPFEKSFLQLAFENFELSYETQNINLSFLALIVSLETLLNPGKHEIRYRISRNAAVLLGKDREDSKKTFSEIRELYDKRSAIVHVGKSDIINKEDLSKLRYYVRESIKKLYKMDKNKDEILDLLNLYGFGECARV